MQKAHYDDIAEWYDSSITRNTLIHDLVLPPLLELMGDPGGQTICDLACGQGMLCRYLAQKGARVTGVDLSAKLLEIARRYEDAQPLGIDYVLDDAQLLATLADATFDGVVCNMSLMDIENIRGTFLAVARILRPRGWFIFSITHPCFQGPGASREIGPDGTVRYTISDYLTEGYWRSDNPHGVRGKVGAYHRTLSRYLNNLMEAGFILERFIEPKAGGEMARRVPGNQNVPAVLIVRCRKG
ncbi:MAG TPA: methyltransferase domain-containing protein [Ktedonobacteraceae bacterium]|nr:methyltransferase domain-containing protein [Ktedonobacteraceae bacterium]